MLNATAKSSLKKVLSCIVSESKVIKSITPEIVKKAKQERKTLIYTYKEKNDIVEKCSFIFIFLYTMMQITIICIVIKCNIKVILTATGKAKYRMYNHAIKSPLMEKS